MGSSRLFATSTALLGVRLAIVLLAAWGLLGCGGQDETIGQGDAELIFTNHGDASVRVTARWTGQDQRIVSERFWVYVVGKVTLKVPPRSSYDIEMRPDCPASTQATTEGPPLAQDKIIDARHP